MRRPKVLAIITLLCVLLAVGAHWQIVRLSTLPEIGLIAQRDTMRGDDAMSAGNYVQASDAYETAMSEDPHAYRAAQRLVDASSRLEGRLDTLVESAQGDPDAASVRHLFLCYAFIYRAKSKSETYQLTEAAKELSKAVKGCETGGESEPFRQAREQLIASVSASDMSEVTARDVRAALGKDSLGMFSVLRIVFAVLFVVGLVSTIVSTKAGAKIGTTATALSQAIRTPHKGEVLSRGKPGDPPVVKSIGDYDYITHRIGDGNLKILYKGVNPRDHGVYAIAQLQPKYVSDPDVVAHFHQGSLMLMKIDSPWVVAAFEYRAEGGQYYSVMEFLEGETLTDFMKGHPTGLQKGEAYPVLVHLCEALKEIHGLNLVHRDVKPDNFKRAKLGDGPFKLLDFDTCLDNNSTRLTMIRSTIGTPDYMSPEQRRGDTNIGFQSDIYSLAVMFFEMLTGHLPSAGPFPNDPAKTLSDPALALSQKTIQAVLQAMSDDPNKRFSKVQAFLTAVTD